jgi:hypothetical protein
MNQIKDKVGNGKTYGVVDIDAYIDSIKGSMTYRAIGANMIVAGLMSDAQELLSVGDNERARQTLNRAKAVLFQIMDGQLIGTINTNE